MILSKQNGAYHYTLDEQDLFVLAGHIHARNWRAAVVRESDRVRLGRIDFVNMQFTHNNETRRTLKLALIPTEDEEICIFENVYPIGERL